MIHPKFIQPKLADITCLHQLISTPAEGFISALLLRSLIRRNPLDALLIYTTTRASNNPEAPIIKWIKENLRTSPYLNN